MRGAMADPPIRAPSPLGERSADELRAGLPTEAQLWLLAGDPGAAVRRHGAQLEALLSAEEQRRGDRLVDRSERARFVVAHGFKRLVLSRTLGLDPAALRFEADENGKPALTPDPSGAGGAAPPAFSLSHTRGCVAVLVGGDRSLREAASHYAAANVEVAFAGRRGEQGALPSGIDYYLSTTRDDLDARFPGAPIVHEIGRRGAVFCVIKGRQR